MNFCNQSQSNWNLHIRLNLCRGPKKIENREDDFLLSHSIVHLNLRNHGRQTHKGLGLHLSFRGEDLQCPSVYDWRGNDIGGAAGVGR